MAAVKNSPCEPGTTCWLLEYKGYDTCQRAGQCQHPPEPEDDDDE
jgi:hypothetical protein